MYKKTQNQPIFIRKAGFLMKKLIIILFIISIILTLNTKQKDYVVLPSNSIRFRIIPNSNSLEDILMKEKVKTTISNSIKNIEETSSLSQTRTNILSNKDQIEQDIDNLFKQNKYNKTYSVNYGINYFPEKIYKGIKYESGYYESLVINIGSSSGDNFWCVLFPPLCMMDTKTNDTSDIEYTSLIKEIINKYKNK